MKLHFLSNILRKILSYIDSPKELVVSNRLNNLDVFYSNTLPKEIQKELKLWVKECRKIKDNPLSELVAHENVGYKHNQEGKKYNSYQCSIPPRLVEGSYTLGYIIRLAQLSFGRNQRDYRLGKHEGHFDGFDIWMNFAYKNDQNPPHTHSGDVSGVIYVKNDGLPTIFWPQDSRKTPYKGSNNTITLFPSDTTHMVEQKTTDSERITIAFNLVVNGGIRKRENQFPY